MCVTGEAETLTLYTGSEDGTIRAWNVETCEVKKVYQSHKGAIASIVVQDDNIVSASVDHTVIHWNLAGEIQKTFTQFEVSPRAVAATGDSFAVGCVDGKLKFFSMGAEGALTNEVNAHNDIISCVAFNSGDESGTQIFTASYDKTIKSWDPATGAKAQLFEGHTNHVKVIAFGNGGATLFSGSRDETVRTWNVMDGKPIIVLQMPGLCNTMAVYQGNLYCGFSDGKVRVLLNRVIQAKLAEFKKQNHTEFEAKKKEAEAKLEKTIKKMKAQLQKRIKQLQEASKPAEVPKGEGEEGDEEAAPAEEAAEAGDDARNAELGEKMQQELDQQVEFLRRNLQVKIADYGKVRDRKLVVDPELLQDYQSHLVQTLMYEGPSILAMCVGEKNLYIGSDNEVIKSSPHLAVQNL